MTPELPDLRGIAILFDLDGTLVDSAPDLVHTLNTILYAHKIPILDEKIARPMISLGARNMILTGLERAGHNTGEDFLSQLHHEFLDHYSRNIAVYSKPFEGVEEILEHLQTCGAVLGVCTNKTQEMAVQLLDELQLANHFKAVAGRDRFDVFKPHPAHLLKTAELMNIPADQTIMVGDSSTDIETAKAANVPVIAATFGYETCPVQAFEPDAVFSHYSDLPNIITTTIRPLLSLRGQTPSPS